MLLQGMTGAIREAEQLVAKTSGGYMLQQFENPSNPDIHFRTTGPEIWRDTAGTVAAFISGTFFSFLHAQCFCCCHLMVYGTGWKALQNPMEGSQWSCQQGILSCSCYKIPAPGGGGGGGGHTTIEGRLQTFQLPVSAQCRQL